MGIGGVDLGPDVSEWSTTVSAPPGITVTYPTTRGGSDTSLYGSSTLVGTTRDFTAFRVSVPYSTTSGFQVTLRSTYVWSSAGGNGDGGNAGGKDNRSNPPSKNGGGNILVTDATVFVPIRPATGAPVTLKTRALSIKAGSNDFQRIVFTAGQADLGNVSMTLGALPAGLELAYPGDRQSAGLNGGTTLVGGTTDYASVRFNATKLGPGTYRIPLTLTYTAAAAAKLSEQVVLVVG